MDFDKTWFDSMKKRILDATREGPITSWTERIAQFAKAAQLPVEEIDWSGSARSVAFKLIDFVARRQLVDKLEGQLIQAEQGEPDES